MGKAPSLRWVILEPSSLLQMESNGLEGNLEQKDLSMESHTATIHSWQLVNKERSSLHLMEPNGLEGNLVHH